MLDDFGHLGKVYRETDEAGASREDVIDDLLTGQFNNPLRVIAFDTAEGWSRDVSEDIAWEITRRVAADQKPLTPQARRSSKTISGRVSAGRSRFKLTKEARWQTFS